MSITVLIMAAGHGTRMRSNLPKVLHPLAGKPLIQYSIQTAKQVSDQIPVVVIGHEAERIKAELGDSVQYVLQTPQLGTAHAVMVAEELLKDKTDQVVVISADMPLLSAEMLSNLVSLHEEYASVMTLVSIQSELALSFGRIIRDASGDPLAIVEEPQATPEQLKIKELNAGVYCFNASWLWQALKRIQLSPKGEYYLTDLLGIAIEDGQKTQVYTLEDSSEAIGINTRIHLAEAEKLMRKRINEAWMLAGVTIIDPDHTYIEHDVIIGPDTVIYPNTSLRGNTVIGMQNVIGPNTLIANTVIGDRCKILSSVLEGAQLENEVDIGPFARLRKGAHLANGVHMGNFGEIKNSYLGPETKMGHFSYIGDAQIGTNVNIGAGTITCNYDGDNKHKTEIGDDVFIGSDTMLVAPVKLGKGSRTGAGAVVTHDVPPETTVIGVPARPFIKKDHSE